MVERRDERAVRGLRAYVRRVAAEFGLGPESTYCEVAEFATAYVALPFETPGEPGTDAALVWDQQRGWALTADPQHGEEPPVLAYLGDRLAPAPEAVLACTADALAGQRPAAGGPPSFDSSDLAGLLAGYLPGPGSPWQPNLAGTAGGKTVL